MWLFFEKVSLSSEHVDDLLSSFKLFHPNKGARVLHHDSIVIDDTIVGSDVMALGKLEIFFVVSRCDLHGTCSKLDIDHLIANNGDLLVDDREDYFSADKFFVPLILWMHGYGLIC